MIILDHNATTPVLPEILDAMMPYLKEEWGNPSSQHALGRNARAAVERAREQVASLIGAKHEEIIFTSGGTEATNLALAGTAGTSWPLVGRSGWRGTVSSVIEHPATLETLKRLRSTGHGFRLCRVTPEGKLTLRIWNALCFGGHGWYRSFTHTTKLEQFNPFKKLAELPIGPGHCYMLTPHNHREKSA